LWIGALNNVIGGDNYIDNGGTVYFWELKRLEERKEASPTLTVYITQGDIRINYNLADPRLKCNFIPDNYRHHISFIEDAQKAQRALETKGFEVIIEPYMTREKYIKMMRDPTLVAYYMGAHSNSLKNPDGFYLVLEYTDSAKTTFKNMREKLEQDCGRKWNIDDNWLLGITDSKIIDESFLKDNNISRPELWLVYQKSCGFKDLDWSAYLGNNVKSLNHEDGKAWYGRMLNGLLPIEAFVNDLIDELNKRNVK
jgi:hypothetical protein